MHARHVQCTCTHLRVYLVSHLRAYLVSHLRAYLVSHLHAYLVLHLRAYLVSHLHLCLACKHPPPLALTAPHRSQGADPWQQDNCGKRMALHYAAMRGQARAIRSLLDHVPPDLEQCNGVR